MTEQTEIHDFNVIERPEIPQIKNLQAVMDRAKGHFEPGVVFGMDEDAYHAVPALSSSGIKQVLISGMDFWAGSWMAPPQLKEREDTDAQIIGRAYHKRIVEGRQTFYQFYDRELDREQYPNAIDTVADIRAALEAAGVKPKGTNKAALIAELVHADPGVKVWSRLVEDYAALKHGKILLTNDLVDRIEIAAHMIEQHPQLCKAFTGGMPEVSIFWIDQATGVPMKSRLDYLKPRAVVDLKTIGDKRAMNIERAIYMAISEYKYFLQSVVYLEAASHVAEFVRQGMIHGDVSPEFLNAVALANSNERQFLLVAQKKGRAPVARGVILPRRNMYDIGKVMMRQAIERWRDYVEKYGTDAWLDVHDIEELDDASYPAWATDL